MSQFDTIARPYAKAIYEQALANDTVQQWQEFLTVAGCCESNKEMKQQISSIIFFDQLQNLITQYLEEKQQRVLSKEERNFLSLLHAQKRICILPNIATQYNRLTNEGAGICQAIVYSATKLSEPEIENIRVLLSQKTGRQVSLTIENSPQLLAGVRIEYDGWVIDQSIKGRIALFAQELDSLGN